MNKGRLSPEQEDDCLARSEIRKRNSNKALAAMYLVSEKTVKRGIIRARRRKDKRA
jgi:hypothetical protein